MTQIPKTTRKPLTKAALRAVLAAFFLLTCFALNPPVEASAIDHSSYTETDLYFGGSYTGQTAWRLKGNVYIPVDTLLKYGDTSCLRIDKANSRININVGDLNAYFGNQETTEFIKRCAGTCYIPLKNFKDDQFVSLNVISELAKLSWTVEGDSVFLSSGAADENAGVIKHSCTGACSLLSGRASGKNIRLKEGETAFLMGSTASFFKIKTLSGDICYINKENFEYGAERTALDYTYTPKTKSDFSRGKFNMAWVYVPKATGITAAAPEPNRGCGVLVPTWFHQNPEDDANIMNTADRGYTDLAHENGYEVWACITNSFAASGSTDFTSKVLADGKLRNKSIAQYLFYSMLYDVDGINIDYETVKDEDRDNFTLFCSEMARHCADLGLTLSAALPPCRTWYKEFDYRRLGEICDFITVMSYNENTVGSKTPGPIASKDFIRDSMEKIINFVPREKILMGSPFYSILWKCNASGKKISASSITMISARNKINEWGVTPIWDEETGLHYAETYKDGYLWKIWLESRRSIAERLAIAEEYGIAGTCCWAHAQAEDNVWQIFENVYKNGMSPCDEESEY